MGDGTYERETIVAVATPAGRGGIGVVRVSGADALGVVAPLLRLKRPLAAGRARFAEVLDTATDEVLDEAVVTYFAGPRSYTGEDVVEVAAHGAPVLLEYLLRACCAGGARLAEAGEFTQRAFLAGRIDLTQAEAVGDLIEASTLEQARVAARQMGGALSREVGPVKERLVFLIAGLEAGIDFAEDDIDLMQKDQIQLQIAEVEEPLRRLEQSFAYGRIVREGFQLALVGRPNAGKSSLFNRLLRRERAIVTASPGTTRDPIAERVSLEGIPVELVDTAGLRGAVGDAELDEAERMGIAKSREAMADAAVLLLVVDATEALDAEDVAIVRDAAGRSLVVVLNKMDMLGADEEGEAERLLRELGVERVVRTSALMGAGVKELRGAILATLATASGESSVMVTNVRQHRAVVETLASLAAAGVAVERGVPHEMVLLDLYAALSAMDSLTGATTTDDILHLIFGRFCIGK
ncbi:tRNA uridine-5-carboxymethylaminomethyl(34) synthesis GTPase MnmE [Granulicella arctica]|uniref:tRNA modification GTPase MnmE n=1 Tax=Granulicella arctica TaxID=940613 RepID=A0A7Y9PF00_9BACT|nr:tRNA uridine-5-carboxymethylaminomethyl(34) synthesis GTPase MnmE [Granulicella arctica]NYF78649.1 tRNA modification GTPase [Granulicella arctica]